MNKPGIPPLSRRSNWLIIWTVIALKALVAAIFASGYQVNLFYQELRSVS